MGTPPFPFPSLSAARKESVNRSAENLDED
jgi:hypothetical protein